MSHATCSVVGAAAAVSATPPSPRTPSPLALAGLQYSTRSAMIYFSTQSRAEQSRASKRHLPPVSPLSCPLNAGMTAGIVHSPPPSLPSTTIVVIDEIYMEMDPGPRAPDPLAS